ncbi:MAG: glycosyltransferase family 39 protein [Ignavibacteriae bacterium]|nr:glycosyltransferase family 39 protein [Ignavibacteriota bacterium]
MFLRINDFISGNKLSVLIILVVALYTILNVLYFLTLGIHNPVDGDAHFYFYSAVSMVNGQGFTYQGNPVATFPIGYPLFLSAIFYLFGNSAAYVSIIQIIEGYIIILLLTKIIMTYTKNIWVIILPSLFYVLNYKMMSFNSMTMSESFAVFLQVLIIYLLLKYLGNFNSLAFYLLSALFGLLIITKPTYLYLVFPFEAFILFHSLKLKKRKYLIDIPVSIILLFLVIYPVMKRGHDLFGGYKIVYQGGGVLFCATNLETDGMKAVRIDDFVVTERDEDHSFLTEEVFQRIKGKRINEKDDILKEEAFNNIKRNGFSAVPLYLKNFSRIMFGYPYERGFLKRQPVLIYYYFYGVFCLISFLVSLFYLFKTKGYKDTFILMLVLFALFNLMFHFLVGFDPRYGFTSYIIIYTIIPIGFSRIKLLQVA